MRGPSFFDKFADGANAVVSRAPFFLFCVILVVVWAPSIFLGLTIDTWQLIINTITTIITFLMVSLDANTTRRESKAMQQKLDTVLALLGQIKDTDTEEAQRVQGIEREVSS